MKKTFGPTYIAASYIKYIESAGGRVVPIRYPSELAKHRNRLLRATDGISQFIIIYTIIH